MIEYHLSGKQITDREISPGESFGREAFKKLTAPFIRADISDPYQTLEVLPTYMEENVEKPNGLLIALGHPTKEDALQALRFVFNDPYLKRRFVNSNLAAHQYKEWLGRTGELLGVNVAPVSTPHSVEKNPNLVLGEGLAEFTDSTCHTLEMGGVALITPQAERRPKIGKATAALTYVFDRAHQLGIHNFALVPIGIEIPGVSDYSKVQGYPVRRRFKLNVGQLYERDRLYQELDPEGIKDPRQIGIEISRLFFRDLKELTPPEYHNEKV